MKSAPWLNNVFFFSNQEDFLGCADAEKERSIRSNFCPAKIRHLHCPVAGRQGCALMQLAEVGKAARTSRSLFDHARD